jgi:hypothetical protein
MGFYSQADRQPRSVIEPTSILPVPQLIATPRTPQTRSVLIIDAGVADAQTIIASADPDTTVYQLQSGKDAIGQITTLLAGQQNIASLQIVSHGQSGGLQLGESWLDLQTLSGYVGELKSWGNALSATADILLYGCNVAQGATGQAFVNLLAQTTGADVAASDDITGNAALGGNWQLEYQAGQVEAIGLKSIVAYQGTLATVNFNLNTQFNKDVIENTGDLVNDSADVADGRFLTNANALTLGGAAGNGLPDNGSFAANAFHPAVQLGYTDTNDGNNVWQTGVTGATTFAVTPGVYTGLHLFASATTNDATVGVQLNYSDGTNSTATLTVPDWGSTPAADTADQYRLITGMDRIAAGVYDGTNLNAFSIFGFRIIPTAGKTLDSFALNWTGGGLLNVFGATGVTPPVNNAPTGGVTIAGTAVTGEVLTASNTIADLDVPGVISYTWEQSIDGTTWTPIAGAIAATFSLSAAQVGNRVRTVASYTDGASNLERVTSTPTIAIAGITPPIDPPIIPTLGNLTATAGIGSQTVANWATPLSAGASYVVTTDRPELFEVPPALTAQGNLTYTPKANSKINALVNLVVRVQQANGTTNVSDDRTATLDLQFKVDALVRNKTTQEIALLYVDQVTQLQGTRSLTYGSSFGATAGQAIRITNDWQIVDTADFNRDGIADILLQNKMGDEVSMWMMGANGQVNAIQSLLGQDGNTLKTGNTDWNVIGFADINNDKTLDIVWHNQQSDETAFWFMNSNGKTVTSYDYLRNSDGTITKTNNPLWQVAEVADFDGDGDADLLFRLKDLNQTAIVRLQGATFVDAQYITPNANPNLEIRGVGDANGDRVADIYWQTLDNTQVLVQGVSYVSGNWVTAGFTPIVTTGALQGLGDLDRNGTDDLILRNNITNSLRLNVVNSAVARTPIDLQNAGQAFTFTSIDWQVERVDEFGAVTV